MVASSRFARPASALGALACVACTLTGLGDYEALTCSQPTGTTTQQVPVPQLSATPNMSSLNGSAPIGAFSGTGCIEGVQMGATMSSTIESGTCTLFSASLAATQPWVVPIGGGHVAAAIATNQCNIPSGPGYMHQGMLSVETVTATGASQPAQLPCATSATEGAALPSIVPLPPDGNNALVAWYDTPADSRSDPLQTCMTDTAAQLEVGVVSGAASQSPSLDASKVQPLGSPSVSVRPAAMTALQGSGKVLVAAPDGDGASVWSTDGVAAGTSSGIQFSSSVPIKGFTGARAVAIASATDGSGRIAVTGEIGCAPQTLLLALGTLSGFNQVVTVASGGSGAAVQPTVAWVASQNYWIVTWIATSGGAHLLARRFDAAGNPVGGVIDPSSPAIAAAMGSDGNALAYEPAAMGGSFLKVSLGCAQ